jgi:hypothetical protein
MIGKGIGDFSSIFVCAKLTMGDNFLLQNRHKKTLEIAKD